MSDKKHAKLSASGSKRWMTCTPSPVLEESFPESQSEYAEEGSFAHALAELQLKKLLGQIKTAAYNKALAKLKENQYYSPSLEEYVNSYTDFVMERLATVKKVCKDPVVLLEQRLDFSKWVPEGFGTGDVVIIADRILEVIDLKYGKGVPISAEGNPQIRLYGLGALNQYEGLYDIEIVNLSIVQPRLDSTSSDKLSVENLYKWAEDEVKPKAALAIAGEGGFVPGEHCKFCRAKAVCKARADANLELAKYDFMEPTLLSDEELTVILAKAEELQAWAKDIQEYALDQANNHGKKWPGWKLVEGRSNRKYSDQVAIIAKLKEEGYSSEVYMKPEELKGITELEKAMGKRLFNDYLSGFIIKPAGKPVLVPESDKRLEISSVNSAINDFTEEDPLS